MADIIGNIIFFLSVVIIVILIGGIFYMFFDALRQAWKWRHRR